MIECKEVWWQWWMCMGTDNVDSALIDSVCGGVVDVVAVYLFVADDCSDGCGGGGAFANTRYHVYAHTYTYTYTDTILVNTRCQLLYLTKIYRLHIHFASAHPTWSLHILHDIHSSFITFIIPLPTPKSFKTTNSTCSHVMLAEVMLLRDGYWRNTTPILTPYDRTNPTQPNPTQPNPTPTKPNATPTKPKNQTQPNATPPPGDEADAGRLQHTFMWCMPPSCKHLLQLREEHLPSW